MNLGIVLTTFNRPEYLEQCLDSLMHATFLKGTTFVIVDDASRDKYVKQFIDAFKVEGCEITVVYNPRNRGVCYSLKTGIDIAFQKGCDIVMNLDPDAIVRNDFADVLLKLKSSFPKQIVSGFNCRTKNKNGKDRHMLISEGKGWNMKTCVGGINIVFDKPLYHKYIEPSLVQGMARRGGNWDTAASLNSMKDGRPIVCSVPSVLQHIGVHSTLGHGIDELPDTADDFIPTHQRKLSKIKKENCGLIISQFAGLGDILFAMPLINTWIDEGYKVIWPVVADYVPVKKHFPKVTFMDMSLLDIDYNKKYEFETGNLRYIPLRWAEVILKLHYKDVMKAKYILYGKDFEMWRDLSWVRDVRSENRLFKQLGLNDGEQYNLINTNFRTDQSGKINIKVNNGLKNIELKNVPGYTMLDWGRVIENASTIHTVGTSINYMIEIMDVKADLHLYIRKPDEKDFSFTDYLWKKKWEYHY